MCDYEQVDLFDEENKKDSGNSKVVPVYPGLTFGDYEVVEETLYRRDKVIFWKCKCIYCGKEKLILSSDLRKNNNKCECECMKGKTRPENTKKVIEEYWAQTTYKHRSNISRDRIPGVAKNNLSDHTVKYYVYICEDGIKTKIGDAYSLREAKDMRLAAEREKIIVDKNTRLVVRSQSQLDIVARMKKEEAKPKDIAAAAHIPLSTVRQYLRWLDEGYILKPDTTRLKETAEEEPVQEAKKEERNKTSFWTKARMKLTSLFMF